MRVPDYLEPITGYRVWRVAKGGLLTGVHVCEPWVPKQAHKASCQRSPHTSVGFWMNGDVGSRQNSHLIDGVFTHAPVLACLCGLWATKQQDPTVVQMAAGAPEAPTREGFAWGTVSLWGRVIEHTDGWRAEFAYPKALTATSDAEQIAALYGIPCEAVVPTQTAATDDTWTNGPWKTVNVLPGPSYIVYGSSAPYIAPLPTQTTKERKRQQQETTRDFLNKLLGLKQPSPFVVTGGA